MRIMLSERAGQPFTLRERGTPQPSTGQALIRVHACGVCHSDQFVREAAFPGVQLPRAPGHEVVGVIESVGERVLGWRPGDRVGVGWHGGHCFACRSCRVGDFVLCEHQKICGISYDGGYADYMVAPVEALARIPASLTAEDAAPLLCAGVTTYNSLRNSGARPGDVVAVQGIGGLGHLAVQFARKMGYYTVALSRGADKRDFALQLGAHEYIDAAAQNPAQALQRWGGARVVLATAPSKSAVESTLGGLAQNGQLLLVAAFAEPIELSPLLLIAGRRRIQGWPSGHARDSEDTLNFAAQHGVRAMIETFPLEEANAAYDRMMTNAARFRAVLRLS